MPNHSLDAVFRALADPTRRAVVHQLTSGSAAVSDLYAPFAMAMPSFLQHLRVLEDAGLVRSRKAGRIRTVELRPRTLASASRWLDDQRAAWEACLDRLDDYLATLKEPTKP